MSVCTFISMEPGFDNSSFSVQSTQQSRITFKPLFMRELLHPIRVHVIGLVVLWQHYLLHHKLLSCPLASKLHEISEDDEISEYSTHNLAQRLINFNDAGLHHRESRRLCGL